MKEIAALPLWLLFSLSGCSSTHSKPLAMLSVSNPSSNAQTIAEAVDRLCLHASTDPDDFSAAVRQTGWPVRKTQSADRETTLAVWQLPHATIIYSERPFVAPDADVWTCTLIADRTVSPPRAILQETLVQRLVRGTVSSSPLAQWEWKPSLLTQADMSLTTGETGGLDVSIDYGQLKPLRALFGK